MRINNNIPAVNAHRQNGINNNNVGKSIEKLSSGYRINRAGDDAAGLAISEKMRAQIRGLSMASKNSQDAISLIQTAEGALQEAHNILQRMRELAVQSSSDTNETSIDRNALQQEFSQLAKELDDTAKKTKFNDQGIIDGTFAKTITSAAGDKTKVDSHGIAWARNGVSSGTYSISVVTKTVVSALTGQPGTASKVGDLNGTAKGSTLTVDLTAAKTTTINAKLNGVWTLSVETKGATTSLVATNGSNGMKIESALSAITAGDTLDVDMGDLGVVTIHSTQDINAADIQTISGTIEVKDYVDQQDAEYAYFARMGTDEIQLETGQRMLNFNNSGISLELRNAIAVDPTTSGDTEQALKDAIEGNVTVSKNQGKDLVVQTGANQGDSMAINIANMDAYSLGVASANIASRPNAKVAITQVNNAINIVSTQRAELGALQNRLDHKIANLDTSAENLQSAESRIRDADMAKEMTTFMRNNILAQASTAMLAQANSLPQGVLQLLG